MGRQSRSHRNGHIPENSKNSFYFLNKQQLPVSVQSGLAGKSVSSVISGIRDERLIEKATPCKIPGFQGTALHVETQAVEYQSGAYEPIVFCEKGNRSAIENKKYKRLIAADPAPAKNKTWKRKNLHIAIIRGMKTDFDRDYILMLPEGEARRPKLAATGIGWDRAFECYILPYDKADPSEMSAILQKCDNISHDSDELLRRLRSLS